MSNHYLALYVFKEITQVLVDISTAAAVWGAAWWFCFSRRAARRIEFDLEHRVFKRQNPNNPHILQLNFKMDNKGQVENRFYTLAFEVMEMQGNGRSVHNPREGFIFRSGNIVNEEAEYYYVRPGVCQRITHLVCIPNNVDLVKVRAVFTFENKRRNIDPDKPLSKQYLSLSDWVSLMRVIPL